MSPWTYLWGDLWKFLSERGREWRIESYYSYTNVCSGSLTPRLDGFLRPERLPAMTMGHQPKKGEAMAMVTLKSVARHLGLSVTTVSRALKDGDDVSAETIRRVKEAAEKLGYRPNARGVNLRTGKSFSVCAILQVPTGEMGDIAFTNLLNGLTAVLHESGYTLTVYPQNPQEDDLETVRRVVESGIADGILLIRTRPQDVRVRYLLEHRIPFVVYGRTELATPYAYLDYDNDDAAFRATERLLEKGHRRIALVNPPDYLTYATHRRVGYARALRLFGVEVDEALIFPTDLGVEDARAFFHAMAKTPSPPTGYVCSNELLSMGIVSGMHDLGQTVGVDAAVISFDSTPITAYFTPPLSTFYIPIEKAGRRLAEFLVRSIDGEDVRNLQEVWKTEFIERCPDTLPLLEG